MKKIKISILIVAFLCTLFPFSQLQAAEFNQNFILSDLELYDFNSMNLTDIQKFLELKNSSLASYVMIDASGLTKTAAEVIFTSAQNSKINPKFILVMLQKEQSIVEDLSPSQKQYDWAMGYAVCDSCSMDDPDIQKFRGFENQVTKATERIRWYSDHPNAFKQVGQKYNIDGTEVTPSSQATANLYSYTPHIHGNYLFWKIWQRWFKQYYPDGSLLRSYSNPTVYLIQYGEKKPFASMSSLISRFDPNKILFVDQSELEKYELGSAIRFANYSLLLNEDGAIYLLVNDEIKHIDSMETFRNLGFNMLEVVSVKNDELVDYNLGEEITIKSTYPMGALLQNNQTGAIFFVQNGVSHPLIAQEIMTINYPKYPIQPVSPEELEKYDQGDIIKFREGELLKSSQNPLVYLVSGGQKKPILTAEVFERLGFKWTEIKVVSENSLAVLPLGQALDLSFKE